MENLNRIIEHYIKTQNTFYALLINGDWGCGKTFFIKANYLRKQQTELRINGDEQRKPQFCYISLNGLTKTDDIMTQFTTEILSTRDWKKKFGVADGDKQTNHFLDRLALGVTKNAQSIFGKALDKIGVKPENIAQFFNPENCVFFIDDLERCKLPIEETLGYINTHFVEHAGLKVIFLANEREITSNDKNQSYKIIKEKIIGRTIEFKATLEESLSSIVAQYSDELQRFVKQYRSIIIECISMAEFDKKHNLRTLQFAFGMFEPLLKLMNEYNADMSIIDNNSICEIIINYFFCACYIHKAGKKIQDEVIKIMPSNGVENKQIATTTNVVSDKPTELAEIIKMISIIRYKYEALGNALDAYIEFGYWSEVDFINVFNDLISDFQGKENLEKINTLLEKIDSIEFNCFKDFKNDLEMLVYLLINNNKLFDNVIRFFRIVIRYKILINEIKPDYSKELIQRFVNTANHYERDVMAVHRLKECSALDEEFAPLFDEMLNTIEGKKTPPSLPVTERWFLESVEDLKMVWQQSYSKEQIQNFSKLVIDSIIHSYEYFYRIKTKIQSCTNSEIIEQLLYDLEHRNRVENDELIHHKLQIIINLLSIMARKH